MPDAASARSGADPVSRDFAATLHPPSATPAAASVSSQQIGNTADPAPSRASSHMHYAPSIPAIDPALAGPAHPGPAAANPAFSRSETEFAHAPGIRRRPTRAGTFKTVEDFHDYTVPPGWRRTSMSLSLVATLPPRCPCAVC